MSATKEEQLIDALCYAVGIEDPDGLYTRVKELAEIANDSVYDDSAESIIKRLAKWCGVTR